MMSIIMLNVTYKPLILSVVMLNVVMVSVVAPTFPHLIQKPGGLECYLSLKPGNTKGRSITVPLTSCLTDLD
jgi:hypothetical protein